MKKLFIRTLLFALCASTFLYSTSTAQLMEIPPYSYNEYRVEAYNVTQIERYINEKEFEQARTQLKFLQGANYKNYKLLASVRLAYLDGNKKAIKEASETCFRNGVTLKEYTEFVSKFQPEIPKPQTENYQALRQQYLKTTNQPAIKKLCKAIENSEKLAATKKTREEIAVANRPQEKTLDSLITIFGSWPGVGILGSAMDPSCGSVTKILENADYAYNKKMFKTIVSASYALTESWEMAETSMSILMKQARSESCNYIPLLYMDAVSSDDDFAIMMEALLKISKQDDVAEIVVYPVEGAAANDLDIGFKRIEYEYSDMSIFKKFTFSKEKVNIKSSTCIFKSEKVTYVAVIKQK